MSAAKPVLIERVYNTEEEREEAIDERARARKQALASLDEMAKAAGLPTYSDLVDGLKEAQYFGKAAAEQKKLFKPTNELTSTGGSTYATQRVAVWLLKRVIETGEQADDLLKPITGPITL